MSSTTSTLPLSRRAAVRSGGMARDYAELIKARVTSLIMMTAWSGYYFACAKSGISSLSWSAMHAVLGVGFAAAGTAALNEVMERDLDARMNRTARRPLVTGTMSRLQGSVLGLALVLGGTTYLFLLTNWLAAVLTFATALVYLAAYTPLKRVHPVCTFIGAFPGAMPPVLGWAVARGRLDPEALVLFAIVFFWQFPHFHSIAWLYREDYKRADIRMLPVVEADGRSTVREILLYLIALVLTSLVPPLFGMTGRIYLFGALLLGAGFFWTGWRLASARMSPENAESRRLARHLLQASVIYLPLLFALMMFNAAVL